MLFCGDIAILKSKINNFLRLYFLVLTGITAGIYLMKVGNRRTRSVQICSK